MSVRGTIILADNVYKTVEGKWVIAGSFNTFRTTQPRLRVDGGLSIYVRLLLENPGVYPARVWMTDHVADPRGGETELFSHTFNLPVRPEDVPVLECRLQLASFVLRPNLPPPPHEVGMVVANQLRLRFSLHDEEVAYCPLTALFFLGYPDADTHDEHRIGQDS